MARENDRRGEGRGPRRHPSPRDTTASPGGVEVGGVSRLILGRFTAPGWRPSAAIDTLKRLEAEQRPVTPEEQQTLAKYVGWGGVSSAFKPEHPDADRVRSALTEGHDPIDEFATPMSQLPQPAHRFHPAEDLLDQLSFLLAKPSPGVRGGPDRGGGVEPHPAGRPSAAGPGTDAGGVGLPAERGGHLFSLHVNG